MSAFIVSKAHIDALVHAGLRVGSPARGGFTLRWSSDDRPGGRRQLATRQEADRVGAMLWNENARSVDHRYNEANDRDVYDFAEAPAAHLTPVTILKAIDCYEYQSCEHDEWATSEAAAFCQALRKAMIRSLPGYEAAPWGLDDAAVRS